MNPHVHPAPEAQAFWFDDETSPLMGWFHAPSTPMRTCGVVLCAPFGHEYLVTYRAYRKLAICLAEAGFPVCFFDYAGCGDSADTETPALQAWQYSISQAIKALKEKSGVPDIALFGVRLGALLAASVATQEGVTALGLIAPIISGRSYARELVTFAKMSPIVASPDPARAIRDDEVAGYSFDKTSQRELSSIDLLKMVPTLKAAFFISTRDDIVAQDQKLLSALRLEGHDVTLAVNGGYAAMMTNDAHNSKVPTALWEEATAWLSTKFERQSAPPRSPLNQTAVSSVIATIPVAGGKLTEELVNFDGLVGVLTHGQTSQASPQPATHRIAVVLSNIGSSHRAGNHRLQVTFARSIAEAGFHVLRFDRAGMGYSRLTPIGEENEVYAESGVKDIQGAMDYLSEKMGSTNFLLAGLCSGAYFSYLTATVDTRVKGLVMINPLVFQWNPGDSLDQIMKTSIKSNAYYLNSLWQLSTWKRIILGDIAYSRIFKKLSERFVDYFQKIYLSKTPTIIAQNFLAMEKRGVNFLFVFSENDSSEDVVNAELGVDASILKNRATLSIEKIANTDHTLTPIWSQNHVKQLIVEKTKNLLLSLK